MQIFMTGIDHVTAGVQVRERFSFTSTERQRLLEQLMADASLDGCVLLSTCNRTELWVCAEKEPELVSILCRWKGLEAAEYAAYFTSRSAEAAVRYLFQMTSGLHSRIIGEDQILAQVKKAWEEAHQGGFCGSVLDVLFRSAVTGAKKVKTQLSLSTANASAVELAIQHLSDQGMDFSGKRCLVIGNGEMGKRTAQALIRLGADVTVTIRQYRSGVVEVVPGCKRINYADRYDFIPRCDILVSATSSPNFTITRSALAQSGYRDGAVLLDLAVPRDMEPEVSTLPGLNLMDIDRFSVTKTEELEQQLAQAEALLAEQQAKFLNWLECRDLLPTLDAVGKAFAEDLLFRLGQTLKALPEEHRHAVVSAVQESSEKVAKKMLFAVRDEAGTEVFHRCVEAASKAWE